MDLSKVCRLCFSEKSTFYSLIQNCPISDVRGKIKECVNIEISEDVHHVPEQICDDCLTQIQNWIKFKEKCLEAYTQMKKYPLETPIMKTKLTKKKENDDPFNFKCKLKMESVSLHESSNAKIVSSSSEMDDIQPIATSQKQTLKKPSSSKEDRRAYYRLKYYRYQRKTYPCDICEKQFTRFCDLFNHDKTDHDDVPRTSMCNVCGKLFVSDSRLHIHEIRYHSEKPFACDICAKRFLNKRTLQKHLVIHSKCYVCPYCNLSTSSSSSLTEHVRVHTREKPFTCDECGNSYISQQGLNSHKKTHSAEKWFMCDVCGYTARNQSSIYIHKGTHSNSKPFICECCGKAFKSKIRLNEHHRRHTAEKRFICETCNTGFRQHYQLLKHHRVHSGEKPYKCDVCEKRFARGDSLNEHKRLHTGEKRYTCQICLQAFSFLKAYKKHECIVVN